jgi:hypothetical protein
VEREGLEDSSIMRPALTNSAYLVLTVNVD